jgi:rhodanese-related sulfurtransferase
MMSATISREELKAKLDAGDNFVLIEAAGEAKYRSSHLPRALNMPQDQVLNLAPKLLPNKDADVVLYCGSPT